MRADAARVVENVAASIADGAQVDWAQADAQVAGRELRLVRQLRVIDTGEAVGGFFKADSFTHELMGQPMAAVQTYLHVERQIGLQPHMHEAEFGVQVILVNVQALARAQLEASFRKLG